ncbi:hypothetical protein E2C01_016594 [Portunus trituberculatus]|uniref:Uncharacterized protein n=1 Tax=Portunus trituberculatus TaxID=210409 RepID=A0A5B7DPU3_PORTR|nr:hypothetical protein [Portunus trituberculatus]
MWASPSALASWRCPSVLASASASTCSLSPSMSCSRLRLFLLAFLLLACGGTDVGEVGEYLLGVLSLAGARLTADHKNTKVIS